MGYALAKNYRVSSTKLLKYQALNSQKLGFGVVAIFKSTWRYYSHLKSC